MITETLFGIEIEEPKCVVGATHWLINKWEGYCFNTTVTKISQSKKSFGCAGFTTHTGQHVELDIIAWIPIKYFRPIKPTEEELLLIKAKFENIPRVGDIHWHINNGLYIPTTVCNSTKKNNEYVFTAYYTQEGSAKKTVLQNIPIEKWVKEHPYSDF